jgi:hypothetical protein
MAPDAVLCLFMKILSLFNQGVEPDFPPIFEKHQYQTPEPSMSLDILSMSSKPYIPRPALIWDI